MTPKDHFRIPETLAHWPWERKLNPLYEEVKAESAAWVESFNAFSPKAQRAFNACDFNLCAALAYPFYDKERLRTCMDVMNYFFVFDELSDVEDENRVHAQREAIMDALRNPHKPRPEGESVLGEMARQSILPLITKRLSQNIDAPCRMWARALPTTSEHAQMRFIESFDGYTAAVVQEAEDRRLGNIRSIEDYLRVRRGTVGVRPSFALYESGLDLDEETLQDKYIRTMESLSVDMSILGNDMVSYIMERDKGHGAHNLVTAIMHELKTDINGALRWIENKHALVVEQFLEAKENVEVEGDDVKEYIWGLGNWVRAIDCWYFESERYWGPGGRGLRIQKERWIN